MPQYDARRTQFDPCRDLTSALNDDRQTLTNTALMQVGDTLAFYDKDASGCIDFANPLGTRTVTAICTDAAVVYDSAIDLTVVTGTAVICIRDLDDVQVVLERLDIYTQPENYPYRIQPAIVGSEYDVPIASQARHQVADIICDSGLAVTANVVSVDVGNQKVVIDDNTDLSLETGCKLVNMTLTLALHLKRLKADIGGIRIYHHFLDDGDCDHTAYKYGEVFLPDTTEVRADGPEPRKGTCGTLAFLEHGTFPGSNDSLRLDSLVTGTNANTKLSFEVVSAAGTAVTVTGSWDNSDILISINNDTGNATAAQMAAALAADPSASRYFHARYGGDGTGNPGALAATPFAGGLDDWTGDYCELEQLEGNLISGTGYRWISFHVDPDDPNRLSSPHRTSEEIWSHYSKAS
jgi:hypothetical protein